MGHQHRILTAAHGQEYPVAGAAAGFLLQVSGKLFGDAHSAKGTGYRIYKNSLLFFVQFRTDFLNEIYRNICNLGHLFIVQP